MHCLPPSRLLPFVLATAGVGASLTAQELLVLSHSFGGSGGPSFVQIPDTQNPALSALPPLSTAATAALVTAGTLGLVGANYSFTNPPSSPTSDLAFDPVAGTVYATNGRQIMAFRHPRTVAPNLSNSPSPVAVSTVLTGLGPDLVGIGFDPVSSANGSAGILWALSQQAGGNPNLIAIDMTGNVASPVVTVPMPAGTIPSAILTGLDWYASAPQPGGGTSVALVCSSQGGVMTMFQFFFDPVNGVTGFSTVTSFTTGTPTSGTCFGVAVNRDGYGIVTAFTGAQGTSPILFESTTTPPFSFNIPTLPGANPAGGDIVFLPLPNQINGGPLPSGQAAVSVGTSAPTWTQAFDLQLSLGPTAVPITYAVVFGASVAGLAATPVAVPGGPTAQLWLPSNAIFQPAVFATTATAGWTTLSMPVPPLPPGTFAHVQWGVGDPNGVVYLSHAQQVLIQN
jgi:hypothetical protein